MKNLLNLVIFFLVISLSSLSSGCAVKPLDTNDSLEKSETGSYGSTCPLPKPRWEVEQEGATAEQVLKGLSDFSASIKGETEEGIKALDANGQLSTEFTRSFTQVANITKYKSATLGKKVYDILSTGYDLGCQIHLGTFSKEDGTLTDARKRLISLYDTIEGLKKKSPQD